MGTKNESRVAETCLTIHLSPLFEVGEVFVVLGDLRQIARNDIREKLGCRALQPPAHSRCWKMTAAVTLSMVVSEQNQKTHHQTRSSQPRREEDLQESPEPPPTTPARASCPEESMIWKNLASSSLSWVCTGEENPGPPRNTLCEAVRSEPIYRKS